LCSETSLYRDAQGPKNAMAKQKEFPAVNL